MIKEPSLNPQLLIMERNGYPEETYYTFSYSPIPNDDGTVGGIICANSDDTQRVIGERQLALLRDLAADASHARNWEEACRRCAFALDNNPHDLPFAMLYITEGEASAAKLVASAASDQSSSRARDHRPRWFFSVAIGRGYPYASRCRCR